MNPTFRDIVEGYYAEAAELADGLGDPSEYTDAEVAQLNECGTTVEPPPG